MSIADKQMMLKNLEGYFSSILTMNDMTRVLGLVSNELDNYDLSINTHHEDASAEDDLLDAFIAAKELEGRSEKTIERYKYIITGFLRSANVPIRSVTVYHLRKYLIDNKTRGLSDRTLNGYRDIFCSFFNWLQRNTDYYKPVCEFK